MKRIKEVVVVEGKTDTATLKQLFDVDTIETHGSAINKKTIDLIKTTAQNRGVIILTDPDGPGKRIRDKIVQAVPNAKHAFVAQKDARGKKKLGIAEARHDAIIEAIENAVTFEESEPSLSWSEFIDLDIMGNKAKRLYIYQYFHLGYGNVKTLFKRLNMVGITKTQIEEALAIRQ
ncbi:ribonuclease M5 [Intestinibaculum porci]|uniref:ribonuclease M5 n=1 Tax=Intestinibaculum porci TaxID=2487118 RepID=UPI00240A0C13|nr:ribonuclease M5 [Intestinibaculum porci]MDD6350191.1 ribonuclease M5 [Intestinibaculum porci]